MLLKRKIYDKLITWKNEAGKSALLIEGAKRLGKTKLIKEFAKDNYESHIIIDFASTSEEIKSLFLKYKNDLNDFFFFLSSITGVELIERKSLIVFDEVQLYPPARELIESLVTDNRYDYIECGYLTSFKKYIQNINVSHDEETVKLNPLDFEEFLWALERSDLVSLIRKHFREKRPLGDMHEVVMQYFRKYLLIGGMPEAVLEYIESKNYLKVEETKKRILKEFLEEITIHSGSYCSKILQIMEEIPKQLTKHEKKFSLVSLGKDARFREYQDSFMWLNQARMINMAFNGTDPNVGIDIYKDFPTFKVYLLDTGLLMSYAFEAHSEAAKKAIENILADKLDFHEGMIFENIVAQMLTALNKKLFFYSRASDHSSDRMELDFILHELNDKISPIEVKTGKRYTFSSINKFETKFSNYLDSKYIIHTDDYKEEDGIVFLPVYMIPCLDNKTNLGGDFLERHI